MGQYNKTKRSLRPRTEVKNYVETTDIVVVSDNEELKPNGYVNGYDYSDSDDGAELPPLPPVKVGWTVTVVGSSKKVCIRNRRLNTKFQKNFKECFYYTNYFGDYRGFMSIIEYYTVVERRKMLTMSVPAVCKMKKKE